MKKAIRKIEILLMSFTVLILLYQSTAIAQPTIPWAHIGDWVWEDVNANGLQDAGELGIPGVNVTLYDAGDNKLASQLTNATGGYYFPGRDPGWYYVIFKAPAGFVFSPQDQGSDDTMDSDADPTGRTAIAYVPTIDRTFDAGLYQGAAIGDWVWEDVNADGLQDIDEVGIPGVTVNLYNASDSMVATTTTDGTGGYLFSGLVPGEYAVEFVAPVGFIFSSLDQGVDDAVDSDADPATGKTITIVLTYGETEDVWDAGLYQNATIGDYVWDDVNADGIQDAGETGIAGVTVNLYGEGALVATTTTDVVGGYSFTVPPGNYSLEFVAPADYSFSPQDQGADDALDSDADLTTGRTMPITLTSGEVDNTWDAGLYHVPPNPAIDLEKHTNGVDADSPPGIYLAEGTPITWEYIVTNTGNVPLENIQVVDDQIGLIGTIPLLLPGESETLTAAGTAILGAYSNLGTATGTYESQVVEDSDPSNYVGEGPPAPGVRSPGYWKNHPDAWPVSAITIGGIQYSVDDAVDLMWAKSRGDKTYTMFSHLVAAKLNVALRNPSGPVDDAIADGDVWMALYGPVGSNVQGSSAAWAEGEPIKDTLDEYNNGLLS